MKKSLKIFVILLFVVITCGVISSEIFAFGDGFNQGIYNSISNGDVNGDISTATEKIVGTITTIFQVLSVAGVVILGVKYMYSSSSDKAQIKQTLLYAIIGLMLVFAASSIIKLVMKAGEEVIK